MSNARLETYTTDGFAPRERLAHRNRLMRATFRSGAVCAPLDASAFSAQMAQAQVGDLKFVAVQ